MGVLWVVGDGCVMGGSVGMWMMMMMGLLLLIMKASKTKDCDWYQAIVANGPTRGEYTDG